MDDGGLPRPSRDAMEMVPVGNTEQIAPRRQNRRGRSCARFLRLTKNKLLQLWRLRRQILNNRHCKLCLSFLVLLAVAIMFFAIGYTAPQPANGEATDDTAVDRGPYSGPKTSPFGWRFLGRPRVETFQQERSNRKMIEESHEGPLQGLLRGGADDQNKTTDFEEGTDYAFPAPFSKLRRARSEIKELETDKDRRRERNIPGLAEEEMQRRRLGGSKLVRNFTFLQFFVIPNNSGEQSHWQVQCSREDRQKVLQTPPSWMLQHGSPSDRGVRTHSGSANNVSRGLIRFPPYIRQRGDDLLECGHQILHGPENVKSELLLRSCWLTLTEAVQWLQQYNSHPKVFGKISVHSWAARRRVANPLEAWYFSACMKEICLDTGTGHGQPCEKLPPKNLTQPAYREICNHCQPRDETWIREHCIKRAQGESLGLWILVGIIWLVVLGFFAALINEYREKLGLVRLGQRLRSWRPKRVRLDEDSYEMRDLDASTIEENRRKRKRSPSPQPRVPQVRKMSTSSGMPQPETENGKSVQGATLQGTESVLLRNVPPFSSRVRVMPPADVAHSHGRSSSVESGSNESAKLSLTARRPGATTKAGTGNMESDATRDFEERSVTRRGTV